MMGHKGVTRRAALMGVAAVGMVTPTWATAPKARALHQPALKVARPTQAVLQAVARAGQRLVAVGERGLALYSDDAGQSWTQARVPVSCTLTALCFADARRGWAVGNMGVVLATEDAGATWTPSLDGHQAADLALQAARALLASRRAADSAQASLWLEDAQRLVAEGADKPLLNIALSADGSLLAVGAYGLAMGSSDGGRHWRSLMHHLPNPEGLSYYGAVERRGERLLLGEQGLLLRATGAGADFVAQPSPSTGSLFGALALREGPLLLLGLRGRLWRSAEPGAAWSAVQTHVDAALLAGTQMTDGRVVLVGAAGQMLLSHDGGQHLRPLRLNQRFPFTGLAQADDGSLVLVGMRGLLRLTPTELKAALEGGNHPIHAKKPAA